MKNSCSGSCGALKCWLSSIALLLGFITMIGYWVASDATFLGMMGEELFSSSVMLFLFSLTLAVSKSSGVCPCGGK